MIRIKATRARTLPDMVGPGMRVLVCGLNPSIYSADVGIGFARAGNRFWTAATSAGLVSRDRDPRHALGVDRVGMTDMVKRATSNAASLSGDEYSSGAERVEHMVEWLQPSAVCFVGLAGWRVAVDRSVVAGTQESAIRRTASVRNAIDERSECAQPSSRPGVASRSSDGPRRQGIERRS